MGKAACTNFFIGLLATQVFLMSVHAQHLAYYAVNRYRTVNVAVDRDRILLIAFVGLFNVSVVAEYEKIALRDGNAFAADGFFVIHFIKIIIAVLAVEVGFFERSAVDYPDFVFDVASDGIAADGNYAFDGVFIVGTGKNDQIPSVELVAVSLQKHFVVVDECRVHAFAFHYHSCKSSGKHYQKYKENYYDDNEKNIECGIFFLLFIVGDIRVFLNLFLHSRLAVGARRLY